MTQRTERIDELLRQEISDLLLREVGDPRIGFATVTDVETAPDLRHAKVWVSIIGQPKERTETLRALEHAMPFVRRELGKRLRLRRIPEFSVRLDESIERGSRVMQLINDLEQGLIPDELPEGESLPTPTIRMPHEGDAADALVIPEAPVPRTRKRSTRFDAGSSRGRGAPGGSAKSSGQGPGSRGRPNAPAGGRAGGRPDAVGGGSARPVRRTAPRPPKPGP